jgi:ubiquinone biosynthesis protein
MIAAVGHLLRLARAGRVLARHDALVPPHQVQQLPLAARALRRLAKFGTRAANDSGDDDNRLSAALATLGPTYIKLGQFLATRADMIGAAAALDLASLQDRLPPFARSRALQEIRRELKADPDALFEEIGEPVAAASIAQVHKARTREADGSSRAVAVKVLRPGIEARFAKDLSSFAFAARQAERWLRDIRRLRPVEAVATLQRSVALEMDLRMEAAAISEMAQNIAGDTGFRLPGVDWQRTARRVLTVEWIDGISLGQVDDLRDAGHDLEGLANAVIQHFLRHAMRDGFFHADMHPGNLFVDEAGNLVAVDFGIMGRLSPKDRRFLAEILHGFITRDYGRVSRVHFDAGYVPAHHSPDVFAQALRAIGEPIMDRAAEDISMARLLGQLFQVTEQFDMDTQPQLLLLQKTMVVVEGVARTLNPHLNMWVTATPVVEEWMQARLGPEGRLMEAGAGAASVGKFMADLPELLAGAGEAAHLIGHLASEGGLRLDDQTTERLAAAQARHGRSTRIALWVGAAALVIVAITQVW